MASTTYEVEDQSQADTDMGFLAYVLDNVDEFRIKQVIYAFQ